MSIGEIRSYIEAEGNRQFSNIELIASENFVSEAVNEAVGSCATNKYCEGYPEQSSIDYFCKIHPDYVHTGKIGRYYGGCGAVDMIELSAIYAMQKAFRTNYHVNVQPHSGSNANMAAFAAVLKPGDTILSMSLDNGGHLTHGSPVNFSGKLYNIIQYGVTEDGFIDYDDLKWQICKHHPQLVLAGASAYSRTIDFDRIRKIIHSERDYRLKMFNEIYEPVFMVDMAHIAGLVAAEVHPSPFDIADIITTTCHKTLRGPRGGCIFCRPELAKKIDSAVFPGTQGGPLMHVIAGKAIAAEEACKPEFKEYIENVVNNSKIFAMWFNMHGASYGYKVVTGGTDNHMFLLDISDTGLSGRDVQEALDRHGITVNKNCVPGEKRSPSETSGIRIGTAAMTTRGYGAGDFINVGRKIDAVIHELREKKASALESAIRAAFGSNVN